jgi:hypothetical protein
MVLQGLQARIWYSGWYSGVLKTRIWYSGWYSGVLKTRQAFLLGAISLACSSVTMELHSIADLLIIKARTLRICTQR